MPLSSQPRSTRSARRHRCSTGVRSATRRNIQGSSAHDPASHRPVDGSCAACRGACLVGDGPDLAVGQRARAGARRDRRRQDPHAGALAVRRGGHRAEHRRHLALVDHDLARQRAGLHRFSGDRRRLLHPRHGGLQRALARAVHGRAVPHAGLLSLLAALPGAGCGLHRAAHAGDALMSSRGPLRVGVGGPVGSGKTALVERLCKKMRGDYELAVVTNDIYTKEDAEFLTRAGALEPDRIVGVETGGCPHTAIREDASINLAAVSDIVRKWPKLEIVFVESGGDNLAATFSPELADLTIYVIDVAAGEKIPRKGGPGITRSDLLVINKIDLAPLVGANLDVMDRDARRMRGARPFLFSNLKENKGVADVAAFIIRQGGLQARPNPTSKEG